MIEEPATTTLEPLTLETFKSRLDEVERLIGFALFATPEWKRKSMLAADRISGSSSDVMQEVILYFVRRLSKKPIPASFTTAIVKGSRWRVLALIQKSHGWHNREPFVMDIIDSEEAVIQKVCREETKAVICKLLIGLTYREREILKLRYGLGDGMIYTLEETGKIFKVTRERVRQIESKALRKLVGQNKPYYALRKALNWEPHPNFERVIWRPRNH